MLASGFSTGNVAEGTSLNRGTWPPVGLDLPRVRAHAGDRGVHLLPSTHPCVPPSTGLHQLPVRAMTAAGDAEPCCCHRGGTEGLLFVTTPRCAPARPQAVPGCLHAVRSPSQTSRRADKALCGAAVPTICLMCCCHTFFREQTRTATRARHSPPESWLLFSGYKPKLTSVSPPAKPALTGILMSVGQTVKSIHLSQSKPTAFSLSRAGTKPVPVCSQSPSLRWGTRCCPHPSGANG